MISATVNIEFLNYWHAGTGKSSGQEVDAVTEKNASQLPFIAGRHLKGLLRDATRRAEHWGWFAEQTLPEGPAKSFEQLLFGSSNQVEKRSETAAGMLIVDDATLPTPEADFLASAKGKPLCNALYQNLYSTAINQNGTAKNASLRGIEVCVPVILRAPITVVATALDKELRQQQEQFMQQHKNWSWLEAILPLLDSLGASRTRGLGEAQLTVTQG